MAMGREKRNKRRVGNRLSGFEGLGLGFDEEEEEGKGRWGIRTLAVAEFMSVDLVLVAKLQPYFPIFHNKFTQFYQF